MPTISIIIPVYNVESYLRDCLNSIMRQHFKDFEVLLIDDGSSDNSGKICDDYAENDERIRVYHKNNGGVSSARNLGLTEAKGDWICFVDSDDWIEPNTLSSIFPIEDNNIDFVQFGFKQINSLGTIIQQSSVPNHRSIMKKEAYLDTKMYHSAICGYLIKTDIIRQNIINFPESIKYGEDQAFILKALICCHKVLIIDKHFYNYRYREGSAMNSSISFARAKDHLNVIENVSSFMDFTKAKLNPLYIYIFEELILYYFRLGIDSCFNIVKVKKEYSEFCERNKVAELYPLCQKYNSYFTILLCYLKTRILKPIYLRVQRISSKR